VLVIDDHQVVREGLRSALTKSNFEVIGEAASKNEGLAQIAHKSPDVIIVDLNLPDGSGLELVAWARSISRTIGIVVLTLNGDDQFLLAALRAGASAYVLKSAPVTDVIAAVSHAHHSPTTFSSNGLGPALARESEGYGLTSREIQVLTLLPSGRTSALIAHELFISEATIKTHLSNIYRKLGVMSRTEAVAVAMRDGLLS